MTVQGPAATAVGSGDVAAAASRVAQLQGLLSKARSATSTAGVQSFAEALQDASGEGAPEAPAAPEAPPSPPAEAGAAALEQGGSQAALASPGEYVPASAATETASAGAPAGASATPYTSAAPYTSATAAGAAGYGTPGYSSGYGSPVYGSPGYGASGYSSPSYGHVPSATWAMPSATNAAGVGASPGSHAYDSLIAQAASRCGIDPAVLHGLIQQESGFDPNARSGAGALGLTQLMPSTAASLGVTEPLNPAQSIEGGARYLSEMLQQFGGNVSDALAAYNAGPNAVRAYGGVPPYPETEAYVSKVLANAQAYQAEG